MLFNREQKRKAYDKLPVEIQSFIMDNQTTEIIDQILEKNGLADEINDAADSEILYVMYGLQDLDTAIKNIAQISGKSIEQLQGMKSELQNQIFDRMPKITSEQPEKEGEQKNKKERQSNVGAEFEEMILNQAKGMMPARAVEPTLGSMNQESRIMGKKMEAPSNLPSHSDENPQEVHNYGGRIDPYREPTE